MKNLAVFCGFVSLCFLGGCVEPPKGGTPSNAGAGSGAGVIYRHHFIGSVRIGEGTNATKLKEILARESTKTMASEVLRKLARAPREAWTKQLPRKAASGAEFIEPLLADVFAVESYIEARGSTARPECVIAVRAPDERAKFWDNHLRDLAAAWQLGKPVEAAAQSFKGWEIKRREYPNKVQFVRAGQWVVVGFGSDALPLSAEALQAVAKNGAPARALGENVLLEFEADFPRIALPAIARRRVPPTQLTVFGRGEFLRTEARFRTQSLNWKFEPWRIPTNAVPENIISFTAMQGIAPLLGSIQAITELGVKPLPNQACMWGIGDAQGQVFAAIPVGNATNMIQKLAPTLPKVVHKHLPNAMGKFLWASNHAEIVWQGLPWIVPYLHTLKSAGHEYLFFGMFPRMQTSNPPPAELFAQLGTRKDLAYYDWEITGQRTTHFRQMYSLAHLINRRRVLDPKAVGEQWLHDLRDTLGPTVTEVTVKSPNELNLVRKSHIGFTGFELATFSLWLESERFPLEFEFRPRPQFVTNAAPRKAATNSPAPPKR